MKKFNVSNALFSKVQQRVLGILYGQPDVDFHTNEIIRLTHSGTGAVQRELKKLVSAGLITIKQIGNQKHYQANQDASVFAELRNIVLKTFGLADILRESLKPIEKKIQIAFIYGSLAKQEDTASSDIDLLLITEKLSYADLFTLLQKPEAQLNRKINPNFYSPSEWKQKLKEGNNFIQQLVKQPKIFLIGDENELGKFK